LSFPFEWIETWSAEIAAGRESATSSFVAKNPGPEGTIAKEFQERKRKSQKRPEKCRFFGGMWKSPLKMRFEGISRRSRRSLRAENLEDSEEKGRQEATRF
jgi:hypothetical protein